MEGQQRDADAGPSSPVLVGEDAFAASYETISASMASWTVDGGGGAVSTAACAKSHHGIARTSSAVPDTDTVRASLDHAVSRPMFGSSTGEKKMSTAMVEKIEVDLPPPTLTSLDDDVLGQILGYAQPEEHRDRFQWSGSVGRTCRIFRQLSREDSEDSQGVSLDLKEFEKYVSMFRTTTGARPRDLRLELLQRLVEDASMRARVDEFHFDLSGMVYEADEYVDLCQKYRRGAPKIKNGGPIPRFPSIERDERHKKAIFESLTVLLGRPNSFPNLHILDIHKKLGIETDSTMFELFNRKLFLDLPAALPKLDHLCLSNCFFNACDLCTTPLNLSLCAMTSISVDQLVDFATSLKTPLRSLSLCGVPWMSDGHTDALLSVVGKDLRVLELVNCGRRHPKRYGTLVSHKSLQAITEHCNHLLVLRVMSEETFRRSTGLEFGELDEAREERINELDEALESVLQSSPTLCRDAVNNGFSYRQIGDCFPFSSRLDIQFWFGFLH